MSEGSTGRYERPKNPQLKSVQAKPLGYRRDKPFIGRLSRRFLVPLGLATLLGIGAYRAVQQVGDHNRTAEIQPYHQNTWADQIRQKLDGETPYAEGEKLKKNVTVVVGQQPPLEWENGEPKLSDSVEVFDGYPSPYIFTDRGDFVDFTPTVGRIKLETVLPEVLMVNGREFNERQEYVPTRYGAFKARDVIIVGADGKPVKTNPDQIVTINGSFLNPSEQPAPQQ